MLQRNVAPPRDRTAEMQSIQQAVQAELRYVRALKAHGSASIEVEQAESEMEFAYQQAGSIEP